ncbi:MAG: hypothetical protein M5T61_09415 [Acidimicrobiia bacterium]|nr:hypothetical protein [Acidimicrobiia bacterium]
MTAEVRPERLGGWSRIPLSAQLPAIALVGILGVGAVYRPAAPVAFVAVLFLYLVVRWQGRRSTVLAALLPVSAVLMWRGLPAPVGRPGRARLYEFPLTTGRVAVLMAAAITIVVVGLLVADRRATLRELGLRLGSQRVVLVSLVALAVVAPLAVWFGNLVGGLFGEVFFGSFALDFRPAAPAPALLFAASNAVAEEVAYRGAMRAGWRRRSGSWAPISPRRFSSACPTPATTSWAPRRPSRRPRRWSSWPSWAGSSSVGPARSCPSSRSTGR